MAQVWQEVAFHQGLILRGDFLWSYSIDAVGIVAHSDQKGAKEDADVETVSFLPSSHVCRTGNTPGELIGRIELFVLNESAESLCAVLVVVEFEEAEFGGSDGCADKLVDVALVLGVEEEFPLFLELQVVVLLELDHVFEDQLFLGRVFLVTEPWILLLLELPAAFELLVYDLFPAIEEFQELVVHLTLHFQII